MQLQKLRSTASMFAVGVLLGVPPLPAVSKEKKPESTFIPAQLAERAMHCRAVEAK